MQTRRENREGKQKSNVRKKKRDGKVRSILFESDPKLDQNILFSRH